MAFMPFRLPPPGPRAPEVAGRGFQFDPGLLAPPSSLASTADTAVPSVSKFEKALKILNDNPALQKALGIGGEQRSRLQPGQVQQFQPTAPVQPFQLPPVSFAGIFGG